MNLKKPTFSTFFFPYLQLLGPRDLFLVFLLASTVSVTGGRKLNSSLQEFQQPFNFKHLLFLFCGAENYVVSIL